MFFGPLFRIVPPAAAGSSSGLWPPSWRRVAATRPKSTSTTVTKPPTRAGDQSRRSGRLSAPSVSRASSKATSGTSVFPKLTGYIEKWNVDIGDKVKKGQTLATLFVPELVEDFGTKKATVELDKQRIELAKKVVKVAAADVKSAQASLSEAKAMLDKFEAMVERWDSEVKRLTERGR